METMEKSLTTNQLSEITRIFYVTLMAQPLKDRTVRYVNIGNYEIRLWQENGGLFQQVALYENEKVLSEMSLKTKDTINVASYMITNSNIARMFIQQAILKCSRQELITSAKNYNYEIKL